jgi:hypothetical protein
MSLKSMGLVLLLCTIQSFGGIANWLNDITEHEIQILKPYPHVGETLHVVYRVRLKSTADENIDRLLYAKFYTPETTGIQILTDNVPFRLNSPGQWIEIKGQYRIVEMVKDAPVSVIVLNSTQKNTGCGTHTGLTLVDTITGQYGKGLTASETQAIKYRYDFVDGTFLETYIPERVSITENTKIISMMRKLEPRLNDSLALLLHSDYFRIGAPEDMPYWDEDNSRWLYEDVYDLYLKDGWLKAVLQNERDSWIEKERLKLQN